MDRYSNSFGKWKLRTWVLIFNAEKSKRQEKTSAVIKNCINQFCLNQCTTMRTHVTQFIVTPANQAKTIFVVLPSSQSKCEANRSRGSWVMIGHPNKQTKITIKYIEKLSSVHCVQNVPINMGVKWRLLYRLYSMRDYFVSTIL